MIILGIETSCDETAVSIVEADGGLEQPSFEVLAHTVHSQVDLHALYGGVVPMLAKREHAKRLTPLLKHALEITSTKLQITNKEQLNINEQTEKEIREILAREERLADNLLEFLTNNPVPNIDALAVTAGPGLEPALWVGINFAKALALAWDKTLVPVNHMAGHIASVLVSDKKLKKIEFPALALTVSGGHTELVLMTDWLAYQIVGETRDDAAGEAFDKVARILGLPYPGGPEISKLAANHLDTSCPSGPWLLGHEVSKWKLPRPMINSGNLDFSFSGLKTAVLYLVKNLGGVEKLSQEDRAAIAYEFQEAVIEVLIHKTLQAVENYTPKTFIAAGGVLANQRLRTSLEEALTSQNIPGLFPTPELATDNATMIAVAAYFQYLKETDHRAQLTPLTAKGNLRLS